MKGNHGTDKLKHALTVDEHTCSDLIEENILITEMGAHLVPNTLSGRTTSTAEHGRQPEWYIDEAEIVTANVPIGVHTVHFLSKVLLRVKIGRHRTYNHSASRGFSA